MRRAGAARDLCAVNVARPGSACERDGPCKVVFGRREVDEIGRRAGALLRPRGYDDPVATSQGALGLVTVLLVEDDPRIGALARAYLEERGMVVSHVMAARAALDELARMSVDVILLDLMLPDDSGLTLCQRIRARSDVPILILTALGEEAEQVAGFEAGADDYVVKPFSLRSLVARIEANVRRARGKLGPVVHELRVGELLLSPGTLEARLDGEDLHLTAREFSLLHALAERAGRVVTRDQLLGIVHGSVDEAFGRSIDIHVSKIRQKLGDDPRRPRLLKTVRGKGYLYAVDGP